MTDDVERCYRCGEPASEPGKGTIYVRRRFGTWWNTVAICGACWSIEEPDRDPIRVRDE